MPETSARGHGRVARLAVVGTLGLVVWSVVALVTVYLQHDQGMEQQLKHAKVTRVVSGDSLEITSVRQRLTVQLVAVQAADPGTGCLADPARDALQSLVPVGSTVSITEVRGAVPRPGLLAATVSRDARPVEVELMRTGLVAASGLDAPGLPDLHRAADDARAAGVGFYDGREPCTVPGQVHDAVARVEVAMPDLQQPGPPAATEGARLDEALVAATRLRARLAPSPAPPTSSDAAPPPLPPEWRALSGNDVALLRARLDAAIVGGQAVRLALAAGTTR
ncbi:hypothetical protein [Arsenicicoccus sp. oral taxon 190]|uniref:hypothetical protein n=1 Tax=Arsenicicoccus sp. oral taxon 190 TaxID=1658671 RepID=UPI00067A0E33|nr:hypothetical protein [Arsenicicoccus sp. oral taxon 190]AKT50716.1 hypothetical protein ADJ73_04260 [Arsenicicoccus sp. oral taxon 190]